MRTKGKTAQMPSNGRLSCRTATARWVCTAHPTLALRSGRRPSRSLPALKALIPFETWRDPFNGQATRGGATELGIGASWHLGMGLNVLMRRHAGDPAALGQAVSAYAQEVDRLGTAGYWSLPVRDFAPLRRQTVAPAFFETDWGAYGV